MKIRRALSIIVSIVVLFTTLAVVPTANANAVVAYLQPRSVAAIGGCPQPPELYFPNSGTPVASDTLPGWPASRLTDRNTATVWSSLNHSANPSAQVWFAFWFDNYYAANFVTLVPRSDNGQSVIGVPQYISVYYSPQGGGDWQFIKTITLNNYMPPAGLMITIPEIITNGFLIVSSGLLPNDGYGGYYFQMAEAYGGNTNCLEYTSQLFPYTYVPSDYITGGWTREPGITKVTGTPGPMLRVTQNATVQASRMLGFSYSAPAGKKIVRVDFSYDANYNINVLTAGLDYPGKWLHWRVSSLGGYQFASVDVPSVDWVGFGLFVGQTMTIPFADWHFRVRDVRLYFSDGNYSPVYSGKLKVSPKMGGAITHLGLSNTDIVDVSDCGRLIQISLGDGTGWNPTQACDGQTCGEPGNNYTGATQVIMNGNDVTQSYKEAWEIDGTNTTIVSDKLFDWGGTGRSNYTVKQTTTLTQYSGIYLIEYEVTNWGDLHSNVVSFEFPAVYLRSDLTDRFVTWQSGSLAEWVYPNPDPFPHIPNTPQEPCGGLILPSERWFALVNANHDGIVAYWPIQQLSHSLPQRCQPYGDGVGFVLAFHPQGAANSNYFTIHYTYGYLPIGQTLKFHLYIASGHLETIRPLLQNLP
jgi:hypothetical protein